MYQSSTVGEINILLDILRVFHLFRHPWGWNLTPFGRMKMSLYFVYNLYQKQYKGAPIFRTLRQTKNWFEKLNSLRNLE